MPAETNAITAQMRVFNRFYTELIGALDERHEGLGLTLAESRCLFTIDGLGDSEMGRLAQALGLDFGYVSRLVSRLERSGWTERTRDDEDRRRRLVALTPLGQNLLTEVIRRSNARMDALTEHLGAGDIAELLAAMDTIHRLLDRRDQT